MQEIEFEFEAIPYQHTVRIPDEIPDGVAVRFLVYVNDEKETDNKERKKLLKKMPNVGSDSDFARTTESQRKTDHLAETKFSPFPEKLTVNREEYNARTPDYLTMVVTEIDIPSRDQRYER